MPRLLQEVCTQALGKWRKYDFVLWEENDHIVVLEHYPCGWKDRFNTATVTIQALQNDCKDHLRRCHGHNEEL